MKLTAQSAQPGRRYNPAQQTTTIRRHTKFTCDLNTTERETYVFRARKLDMEMTPDTLAAFGVNEVPATVEPSVTTEQAASGSLGTHRARARTSNSNTVSISRMISVNSGAVSLIVLKRGSNIAPMHRILRTLSSMSSIHLYWRSRKIATRDCQSFRFLSSATARKFGLGPRVHTDSQ